MRGRGFTLIEVLIALALLVAVLSLVGPALMGRLAPMTFERTAGQLESALLLVREQARLDGVEVYVYAERVDNGRGVVLVARREPVDEQQAIGGVGLGGAGNSGGIGGVRGPDAAEPSDRARGVHRLLELPDGYRFVHEAPDSLDEPPVGPSVDMMPGFVGARPILDGQDDPGADTFGPAAMEDFDGPDLIVVCLPDGSLVMPRPAWLIDPDARAAVLDIDGAVGSVRVTGWVGDGSRPAFDDIPASPIDASPTPSVLPEAP